MGRCATPSETLSNSRLVHRNDRCSMLGEGHCLCGTRHPLLLCTLDLSARSARWVIPMTPAIGWKWNQGTWQDSPFPQAWDLRSESGLRIWAYQDGDSAEMCLEIHHACSDGLGIRQFLRDVFVAYDHFSRFPDKPLKLPALSFERIKQRGDFRRPAPRMTLARRRLGKRLSVLTTSIFVVHRPLPRDALDGRPGKSEPQKATTIFDIPLTPLRQLRSKPGRLGRRILSTIGCIKPNRRTRHREH